VGGVLAAALEMRAHAAMGDSAAAMTALETAEQIHARLTDGDLAASAFGYAESQLRFHAGDTLTQLGDTSAALSVLDRALELCPPEDYTDWALIRLDQAACTVGDGDLDAGIAYAMDTLLALDAAKRQGVITARGHELLTRLSPAQQTTLAVREFRSLLDDTNGMKELPA
jgi:tetratricopeptide (TPR) repeat protein